MANVRALFDAAPSSSRMRAHPETLSDVFDELRYNVGAEGDENVRLGVLLSAVGRRSYGPLLLILGLFSISPATIIPGMTWLSALVILLVAAQMALGLRKPWLPGQVLELKIPRRPLFDFLDQARPKVEAMEDGRWLHTRLAFLSAPPAVTLVALCVIAAALITIPLGLIPFAPLAPGLAVVLFGLGMTARDGVWLLLGMAIFAAGVWLALPLIF